jgi:galactokinase
VTVGDAFLGTYDAEPAGVWSAPGRVNLIGEHTDYNDGFVLPFAIGARTSVAVAPRHDRVLRMRSLQQASGAVSVELDDLAPGRPGGWAAYVAGVVWAARTAGHQVGGMDMVIDGRVPLGSGLSSSHALECAVAVAMNDVFALGLDVSDLAVLSRTAENDFVGAPTGMMDQLASLRCTRGHALFLDTRSLHAEHVPLQPGPDDLALLVVDTGVHHGNAQSGYGQRRASCETAAAQLGVRALRDVTVQDLDDALHELADDELRARARHVVRENARVLLAVSALRSSDWGTLGELMSASHASLRDDYEVSCAELDTAVGAAVRAGALGARLTGGGFGGSVIGIAPRPALVAVAAAVNRAFEARGWVPPTVFEVRPCDGARRDS